MKVTEERTQERLQEREVVLRCQRGEAQAFRVLVERYRRVAYFVALGLVGSHEDALDLSQEAFIRAYQHIRQFDPERRFLPWFYQLLRHLCFNHLRARRRQRLVKLTELAPEELEGLADYHYDPEAIVERTDTAQRVWRAIGQLSDRHREVIVLRHFQQLSYAEMAELLFVPVGTIMSRLHHARRALRDLLQQQRGGEDHEM